MFNIGIGEMFIILLIALIVVGPERMPELARKVGGMIRDLRRMYDNLRGELGTDFDEVERAIRTLKSLDPRRELDAYGRKVIQELAQEVGPEAETLLQSSPTQIKATLKQQLALAPEGSVAQGTIQPPPASEAAPASEPAAPVELPPSPVSERAEVEPIDSGTKRRRTSRVYDRQPMATTSGVMSDSELRERLVMQSLPEQNGAQRKSKVYSSVRQDANTTVARLGHDLLSDAVLDRPVRETVADASSNGHGAG